MIIALATIMTGALHAILRKTPLGRSLRATSEDWRMAQLLGVNVRRNVLVSYVIACGLVAGAGVLFGVSAESINPLLGSSQELVALAIVLVGGLGEVANAGYVAIVMGLAVTFLSTYVSSVFGTALSYVVLIVVVVARPSRSIREARA